MTAVSNRHTATSGGGMTPVDFTKDADGTVTVLPVFSGAVLTKDAAKELAKWLIAKPVDETAEDESDPDDDGSAS